MAIKFAGDNPYDPTNPYGYRPKPTYTPPEKPAQPTIKPIPATTTPSWYGNIQQSAGQARGTNQTWLGQPQYTRQAQMSQFTPLTNSRAQIPRSQRQLGSVAMPGGMTTQQAMSVLQSQYPNAFYGGMMSDRQLQLAGLTSKPNKQQTYTQSPLLQLGPAGNYYTYNNGQITPIRTTPYRQAYQGVNYFNGQPPMIDFSTWGMEGMNETLPPYPEPAPTGDGGDYGGWGWGGNGGGGGSYNAPWYNRLVNWRI